MDDPKKDSEIERLKGLLKRRNAKIQQLKRQLSSASSEEETEGYMEMSPEVVQQLTEIFGDQVSCQSCGDSSKEFSFCLACKSGWSFCDGCGGSNLAQECFTQHITPTHGPFFDMFAKAEKLARESKAN